MASLDKVEGTLVEGLGVVVLVIIAFVVFGVYKTAKGFSLPDLAKVISETIAEAVKQGKQAVENWWNNVQPQYGTDQPPFSGPLTTGPEWVRTGTNIGLNDPNAQTGYDTSVDDYQLQASGDQMILPDYSPDPYTNRRPIQLPSVG